MFTKAVPFFLTTLFLIGLTTIAPVNAQSTGKSVYSQLSGMNLVKGVRLDDHEFRVRHDQNALQ
jgi:hypothetical protein